jgi:hypothetical protein
MTIQRLSGTAVDNKRSIAGALCNMKSATRVPYSEYK